jgi:hypothetical protein
MVYKEILKTFKALAVFSVFTQCLNDSLSQTEKIKSLKFPFNTKELVGKLLARFSAQSSQSSFCNYCNIVILPGVFA